MKIGKIEPLKMQGYKIAEKDGRKYIFAWIDETKGFYAEKTGRFYQDMVMIETPNSEFSDYLVQESLTKEELEKPKEDRPSHEPIGNFSNWKKQDEEPKQEATDGDDDLPF